MFSSLKSFQIAKDIFEKYLFYFKNILYPTYDSLHRRKLLLFARGSPILLQSSSRCKRRPRLYPRRDLSMRFYGCDRRAKHVAARMRRKGEEWSIRVRGVVFVSAWCVSQEFFGCRDYHKSFKKRWMTTRKLYWLRLAAEYLGYGNSLFKRYNDISRVA